jgi:hypothetical protein
MADAKYAIWTEGDVEEGGLKPERDTIMGLILHKGATALNHDELATVATPGSATGCEGNGSARPAPIMLAWRRW